MIKKNVPYKVLKGLWIALVLLTILNIVGVWVGWNGRGSDVWEHIPGQVAFGIVTGVFELLALLACAVVAYLNQKAEVRQHAWAYGLLAVVHLIFVILTFTVSRGEDNSLPALFTVLLVVILLLCAYYALSGKHPFARSKGEDGAPIRREELGANPTAEKVDEIANPENNPDRRPGRDEKTGIVSL